MSYVSAKNNLTIAAFRKEIDDEKPGDSTAEPERGQHRRATSSRAPDS
jgi:hypothetical protein